MVFLGQTSFRLKCLFSDGILLIFELGTSLSLPILSPPPPISKYNSAPSWMWESKQVIYLFSKWVLHLYVSPILEMSFRLPQKKKMRPGGGLTIRADFPRVSVQMRCHWFFPSGDFCLINVVSAVYMVLCLHLKSFLWWLWQCKALATTWGSQTCLHSAGSFKWQNSLSLCLACRKCLCLTPCTGWEESQACCLEDLVSQLNTVSEPCILHHLPEHGTSPKLQGD